MRKGGVGVSNILISFSVMDLWLLTRLGDGVAIPFISIYIEYQYHMILTQANSIHIFHLCILITCNVSVDDFILIEICLDWIITMCASVLLNLTFLFTVLSYKFSDLISRMIL